MRTVSPVELNRSTLARQMLLARTATSAADAVRRIVAVQAQEPASTFISLWSRVEDFDPSGLARAFDTRDVVRASLMRIAIHAVHAEDYAAFHQAMQPSLRAARLHDRRFRDAGISIEEADALLPAVVEYLAEPRSSREVEAWLDQRLGTPPSRSRIWWAMRHYGPFVHAPTHDEWSFGARNRYVAAPPTSGRANQPAALARLIRRYLEGFGPASPQDVRQFAMVTMPLVTAALELLRDELVVMHGPGGSRLFDVPGLPVPDPGTPAPPRLLGMWDNSLLAYADRGRLIPPAYRRRVIQVNGDTLPAILVDGYVAGVWREVDDGIELSAFHELSDDAWAGLAAEAGSLWALLASRDRQVYGRYGHWWAKLPKPAEVRRIRP